MHFLGSGPELLVVAVLTLGLTGFLCRHVWHRTYARWKSYRERTRVRREYWGYE
jgi:hypothetical protein